jgi:hypothetical protein
MRRNITQYIQRKRQAALAKIEAENDSDRKKIVSALEGIRADLKGEIGKRESEKQSGESWEKKKRCLEVAAVAGLWFTLAIMIWQAAATQGQLAEMRADQRPWIKVEAELNGDMNLGNLPIIPVKFFVSNVGHSPALNIQLESFGFPQVGMGKDIFAELKIRCEQVRKAPLDNPARGFILFPGEKTQATEFEMPPSMGGFSRKIPKKISDLEIFGCVDYVIPGERSHHQTGFIYRLGHIIDRPGLTKGFSFEFNRDEVVPIDHLKLFASPSASVQTD